MRDENSSCRNGDSGYTVIEMLIALTLIVTAMIPLAIVLSTSLRQTVSTETRMQAREVASGQIDQIKSMDYDAIGIASASQYFADAANNQQVLPEAGYAGITAGPETVTTLSGVSFQVTRNVRKVVDSSYTNSVATKQITVTVTWTDPSPSGTETLSTIVGPTDMTG